MSIWSRLTEAFAGYSTGESMDSVFKRMRASPEKSVAFTIAVIALGAKMAKADGQVKPVEVAAFREVFHIPPEEEKNAARVFNMARTDVAGFEGYAMQIAAMFARDKRVLELLLDGLFHIALADGILHPDELSFLERVKQIFGVSDRAFRSLRALYDPDSPADPFDVLRLDPDATDQEVRDRWRALVRLNHPDRMIAQGVPEEAVRLATARLAAINDAYEEIRAMRAA
jgi:DnaJ like chaperone protein